MKKTTGILLACLLVFAMMVGLSVRLLISTAEADGANGSDPGDIVPSVIVEALDHYYINQDFGITLSVDPDTDVESFSVRYGEGSMTVPAGWNNLRISFPSEGRYTIYAQGILSDGTRTGEGSAVVLIESLGPAPAVELTGLPTMDLPHSQLEDLSVTVGSVPDGGYLDIALEYLNDSGSSSWLGYCSVNAAGSVVLFTGEKFEVPGTYFLDVTTNIPCYDPSVERYYFTVEETDCRLPVPDFSSFQQDQTTGDWWCFDFHRILADSGAGEGVFILHIELCESDESGKRGALIGKYGIVDGIFSLPVSDFSEGYYIISGYFSALPGYLDSDWSDDYLICLTHSEYDGPEITPVRDYVMYDCDSVFNFAPPVEDGEPVYTADAYELRLQDIWGNIITSAEGLTESSWTWHCDMIDDDELTLSVRAQVGKEYTNWSSTSFDVAYVDNGIPLLPSIQSESPLVPGDPLVLLLSSSFGDEVYDIYVYRDDDPETKPVIHVSHTVERTGEFPNSQSTDEYIELDTSGLADGVYKVWIRASLPGYGFYPVEEYMPDEITIAHVHAMEYTEAVDATCTKDGNTDYWYCSICEQYFADAEGTEIIEEDSWIIEKLGHNLEEYEANKATCTENGNETYWQCTRCGKYFGDDEGAGEIEEDSWIIKALGHDLIYHKAQAPTCTEIGWDAYDTCSRCDYSTYVEKPALGHTATVDPAVAPTHTQTGLTEGSHCSVCGESLIMQKVIPALCDMLVLQLPSSLMTVEESAFANAACEAIIIPDGCTSIGEYAFTGCASLLYVRIPASISDYPENAFEDCNEILMIDWKTE